MNALRKRYELGAPGRRGRPFRPHDSRGLAIRETRCGPFVRPGKSRSGSERLAPGELLYARRVSRLSLLNWSCGVHSRKGHAASPRRLVGLGQRSGVEPAQSRIRMMSPSRLRLILILFASAVLTAGCSPPGAVNEKAVLDSTPHSEPAEYAKSQEDYNNHMIDVIQKRSPRAYQPARTRNQGEECPRRAKWSAAIHLE